MSNNLKVLPEEKKKKGFSFKFNFKFKKINWKDLVFKIIKFLGKLFAGAIILSFLGYMSPELRQQIPSFFKVIDLLLYGLEWLFSNFSL